MPSPAQRMQIADDSGDLYTSTNKVPVSAQLVDNLGALYSSTNPVPISGTLAAKLVASTNRFFTQNTTGSTAYVAAANFGFASTSIVIKNDGSSAINFSFDGVSDHGILNNAESLSMEQKSETCIYFKSATVGQTFRVFAW